MPIGVTEIEPTLKASTFASPASPSTAQTCKRFALPIERKIVFKKLSHPSNKTPQPTRQRQTIKINKP